MTTQRVSDRTQEVEVRRLFDRLKRHGSNRSTRDAIARRIHSIITKSDYRTGEIHHLISGGVQDILKSGCATGLIRLASLPEFYKTYAEIEWDVLSAEY